MAAQEFYGLRSARLFSAVGVALLVLNGYVLGSGARPVACMLTALLLVFGAARYRAPTVALESAALKLRRSPFGKGLTVAFDHLVGIHVARGGALAIDLERGGTRTMVTVPTLELTSHDRTRLIASLTAMRG